jgi:hypothetical protein
VKTLTIATDEGAEKKGRSFQAALLGFVRADHLLPFGPADRRIRPLMLSVAATESEMRAFLANLRCGRTAATGDQYSDLKFELLKSGGYEYFTLRTARGVAVTAFLPSLFRHDPGMVDPAGATFVCLPPIAAVAPESPRAVEHVLARAPKLDAAALAELSRIAPLFCSFLDRRTRCPLVPDERFQLQLLVAALRQQVATLGRDLKSFDHRRRFGYEESGLDVLRLAPGVAFSASHEDIEALLAEQVALYFAPAGAHASLAADGVADDEERAA